MRSVISLRRAGNLSHLLSLYPIRIALDVRCRFGAPWVLDHGKTAAGVVPYHVIVRGHGRREVGERKDIPLHAGDVILFPKGTRHRLYSDQALGAADVPVHAADAAPLSLLYNHGAAPETGILRGQFEVGDGQGNWSRRLPYPACSRCWPNRAWRQRCGRS